MKTLSFVLCGILCAGTAFAKSIVTVKGGDPIHVHPGNSYTITAGSNGGGILSFINDGPNIMSISLDLTVNTTASDEFINGFKSVVNTHNPLPYNQSAQTTVTGTEVNSMTQKVTQFYTLYLGSYIFNSITLSGFTNGPCGGHYSQTSACIDLLFSGGPGIGNGQEFSFDLNNAFQNDVVTTPGNNLGTIKQGANFNGPGGFPPNQSVGSTTPNFVPESPVAFEAAAMAGIGLLALATRRGRSKVVGSLV